MSTAVSVVHSTSMSKVSVPKAKLGHTGGVSLVGPKGEARTHSWRLLCPKGLARTYGRQLLGPKGEDRTHGQPLPSEITCFRVIK